MEIALVSITKYTGIFKSLPTKKGLFCPLLTFILLKCCSRKTFLFGKKLWKNFIFSLFEKKLSHILKSCFQVNLVVDWQHLNKLEFDSTLSQSRIEMSWNHLVLVRWVYCENLSSIGCLVAEKSLCGRRQRYGGWHGRIESLQVLSTLDFGL